MIDKEIVRISYTTNEVGSGHYCEHGQELTHEENKDYQYKKRCHLKHKKENQSFIVRLKQRGVKCL